MTTKEREEILTARRADPVQEEVTDMTLKQLRRRAKKLGVGIRRNRAYAVEFYFIYDIEKNFVVSPSTMMTLDDVEAWLDDAESAE